MIRILKDISVYALGDFLSKGIGFVAIIFYTHYLTKSDMGAYGYILIVLSFANTFLILGLDNAYARYFFEYKSHVERQVLSSTLFLFLALWSIVAIVLPLLYSEQLIETLLHDQRYLLAFEFAIVGLPLSVLSNMASQALRNQFKTKQFVILNLVNSVVVVTTALLLLQFSSIGTASIFLGILAGAILTLPLKYYYIHDLLIPQIDFSNLGKMLRFGLPFVPASVAYWIFSSADRVMLEHMNSLESVGVYTVAASLGSVMALVAGAVGQAWSPHAVQAYEEDKEKARILYAKFLKALMAIAFFLIFAASMIGKELILIIFPKSYTSVFYPMLMLLIGSGFQITTQVTAVGISLAKKTIYFVYITFLISIVNIALNYILIPVYAEKGASFATMVSYGLLTLIYGIISQRLFYVRYDWKYIMMVLIGLVLAVAASGMEFQYRIAIMLLSLAVIFYKKDHIMEFVK